ATAVACVFAWMIFFQVLGGAADYHHPWERSFPWLALSTTTVLPFGFMVDPLAAMMLVVVTTVSLLVQIYSRGYLWEPEVEHHDAHGDDHGADHGDAHAD